MPQKPHAQPSHRMNTSTALPSSSVPGELLSFDSPSGRLAMHVSGQGPALLLIHSVNAAPSSAEVAPLLLHYRATRTVFSLDLPGFGDSERSDRPYTPRLMTDALHAATQEIERRCGQGAVDALALSLSCEFLARAAAERPADYRSLALVSPTGFNGAGVRRGPPGSTLAMPWLLTLLRGPGWGRALFRGLTRPGVIRFFLRKTWGAPAIDEWLWQQAVQTAQAPGAEFAPLHFISGGLFSRDIHTVYDDLQLPVWLCHGVRGDFTDYRQKSRVQDRANWRISVLPTGALPQFEVLERFCAEYDRFLADLPDA